MMQVRPIILWKNLQKFRFDDVHFLTQISLRPIDEENS